jgi:hypothetical protein
MNGRVEQHREDHLKVDSTAQARLNQGFIEGGEELDLSRISTITKRIGRVNWSPGSNNI